MAFSKGDEVLIKVCCQEKELWSKEVNQIVSKQKLFSVIVVEVAYED